MAAPELVPDPPTEKEKRRKPARESVDAWAEAMRRREAKRKAQIEAILDYVRENKAHG